MVYQQRLNFGSHSALSVLALSSRFDGPLCVQTSRPADEHFQYSLCRVVLMVAGKTWKVQIDQVFFQYSLCRVVLMVP